MSAKHLALCCILTICFLAAGCQEAPRQGAAPTIALSPPAGAQPAATLSNPAAVVPGPTEPPAQPPGTLRQAIAYCTDRDALIRSVYPWVADTRPFEARSFLPPTHWAYLSGEQQVAGYPYDPDRGMALLGSLGWQLARHAVYRTSAAGETLALTLTTTDSDFRQAWTAVWAKQMGTCGIQIVRRPQPAGWLFGAGTGLAQRDFTLAAFANPMFDERQLENAFTCESIPSDANGWQGQNFAGWCSPPVQDALAALARTRSRVVQQDAYTAIQREFQRDLPMLPLFYRADVMVANPALRNFAPPDDGMHPWNAALWEIPGKDTIVLGADGEPAGLDEPAYIADVIRALIDSRDSVQLDGIYQPVLLRQVPSVENGLIVEETAAVRAGDWVLDARGALVELAPGVAVRSAGGEVVAYAGGEITLRQLVVDFHFRPGLTWSDGRAVTKADYELGYRVDCVSLPEARPACGALGGVEFISDTHYRVRWKPGFGGTAATAAFLPPFRRAPAHRLIADGRAMGEVPAAELPFLHEWKREPLGVGPYVLAEWVYGSHMTLEANPYFVDGPAVTPRVIVRFLAHDQAIEALLNGDVDILDWETIGPPDVEAFSMSEAQAQGKLRLFVRPSPIWEQITFHLGNGSD